MNNKINLQIEKLNAIGNGPNETMKILSQASLETARLGIKDSQQRADFLNNLARSNMKIACNGFLNMGLKAETNKSSKL